MSNDPNDQAKARELAALKSIYMPDRLSRKERIEQGRIPAKVNLYDERTTADMKSERWSGLRANDLWRRFEIWLVGNLESTLSYDRFKQKPTSLNLWYCEVFGLKETELHEESQKAVLEIEVRKANAFMREELMKGKKL